MSIIIKLQGFPLEASSFDVRHYFLGLTIPDGGVHIVGGDEGTVFIEFANDEDARQAMACGSGTIKNAPIKLLLSSRTEMQSVLDAARKRRQQYLQDQQQRQQHQQQQHHIPQPQSIPQPFVDPRLLSASPFVDPRILSQNYQGILSAQSVPQPTSQPSVQIFSQPLLPTTTTAALNSVSHHNGLNLLNSNTDNSMLTRGGVVGPGQVPGASLNLASGPGSGVATIGGLNSEIVGHPIVGLGSLQGVLGVNNVITTSSTNTITTDSNTLPIDSLGGGGIVGLGSNMNNNISNASNRNNSPDNRARMSGMRGGDDKLFVNKRCVLAASNIPYRATSKDIIEFLSEFNIKDDCIRRRYNQKGQPTADAKIAFPTPDAAMKALKMMNKKILCGRPVFLKPV